MAYVRVQGNPNGRRDIFETNLIDISVERNTLKSRCEMLEVLLNEQIDHAAKQQQAASSSIREPEGVRPSQATQVCATMQRAKLIVR